MSIKIYQSGLTFEISTAWVNWYVEKVTKGKLNTTEWLESASDDEIQVLVNFSIEQNKIFYCK